MNRLYGALISEHLQHYNQMIFLSGPRQVGKTTLAKNCLKDHAHGLYRNWDILNDREKIVKDYLALLEGLPLDVILPEKPILVLDEIHKYKDWKTLVKGLFDQYKDHLHLLITGSAQLNIFRRQGDSLMGRYFLYRVHPFSIRECLTSTLTSSMISLPQEPPLDLWENLLKFGGFPDPFLKQNERFYNRWQTLRHQQILKEDIRDLARIQEIDQLELLAFFIRKQSGQLVNYTSLSKMVRVSDQTIRRWLASLEELYYSFRIQPWCKNITRSLIKEPKVYVWDWSIIDDEGARLETFVAGHLLKAINFWTDTGLGEFGLYYLRDKDKKEVDFLVVHNSKPWFLVEVKKSYKEPLSPSLSHFQQQTKAKHAFQVAYDMPYVEKDCFTLNEPKIVSMKTFLSQLV